MEREGRKEGRKLKDTGALQSEGKRRDLADNLTSHSRTSAPFAFGAFANSALSARSPICSGQSVLPTAFPSLGKGCGCSLQGGQAGCLIGKYAQMKMKFCLRCPHPNPSRHPPRPPRWRPPAPRAKWAPFSLFSAAAKMSKERSGTQTFPVFISPSQVLFLLHNHTDTRDTISNYQIIITFYYTG